MTELLVAPEKAEKITTVEEAVDMIKSTVNN